MYMYMYMFDYMKTREVVSESVLQRRIATILDKNPDISIQVDEGNPEYIDILEGEEKDVVGYIRFALPNEI